MPIDAIRAAGCLWVPVAMPANHAGLAARDGFLPHVRAGTWAALETTLMQQRPAMAYVVPDFHNPTGRLMSDAQRRRLVRAAAAACTILVVDETLRELNLDGVASTPLAAFSSAVVSIGSLSKSHWAGLRTGWIRADESLIQRFAAARTTMDLGGPVVEQLAAAHLVNALSQPLPARLATLRDNRDLMLDLIAGYLPGWQRRTARRRPVRVVPPSLPRSAPHWPGSPGLRHRLAAYHPLRHGRRLRALSSGALHTAPGPIGNRRGWRCVPPRTSCRPPRSCAVPFAPRPPRPSPDVRPGGCSAACGIARHGTRRGRFSTTRRIPGARVIPVSLGMWSVVRHFLRRTAAGRCRRCCRE